MKLEYKPNEEKILAQMFQAACSDETIKVTSSDCVELISELMFRNTHLLRAVLAKQGLGEAHARGVVTGLGYSKNWKRTRKCKDKDDPETWVRTFKYQLPPNEIKGDEARHQHFVQHEGMDPNSTDYYHYGCPFPIYVVVREKGQVITGFTIRTE